MHRKGISSKAPQVCHHLSNRICCWNSARVQVSDTLQQWVYM